MIDSTKGSSLFAAPSFESRSLAGPKAFVDAGGLSESAFLATLAVRSKELDENVNALEGMGFESTTVDRFKAKALWEWTWRSVCAASENIVVDATCIPRELLAILLFAISVRRNRVERVRVLYTAPERYVTQFRDFSEDDRWLSRGIRTLRSILGYPGDFTSERNRHVVAMAGHEDDRLLEIITYLEPTRLSLSNEREESSTVAGAGQVSEKVMAQLRERIGHPEYGNVVFSANSIDRTFASLKKMLSDQINENVALVAMNTKLSFVGAALCALHLRHIRMVYAVPIEYNPLYSEGVGEVQEFDITEMIKKAATTPVR